MENPEEVLQALDEFHKLRPADIPKELEEYLSWVAKTGDPVYQWPLIKALFREKLLRVMTEFYESCPTLELAPCPNVEQFNYDIMKSSLLDRLESFASAPFTVQRICELLTAPRKEYNRVDKFMRAIEKNILVVSTREPGPTARRSENGDGMVNGSSEDNGSRSPYDMDLWTRACTLATTVTVQTVESHSAIVNVHNIPTNVIPVTELTIVKSNTMSVEAFTPYKTDADICDTEMSSKSQDLPSTFTPSTSEIASIANLTSQIQPQDVNSTSGIQNLASMVTEPSNIVGDIPEAIMNEDTNSQPSLDLENNENESMESTRKLQTTFQSSDFIAHGIRSQKFYSEDNKTIEKSIVEAESMRNDLEPLIELEQKQLENNPETIKVNPELKSAFETGGPATLATVITADAIEMTAYVNKITVVESSPQNTASINDKNEIMNRNIAGADQSQSTESVLPDSVDAAMLENRTDSALLEIATEKDNVSCAKIDVNDKEAEPTSVSVTAKSTISCMIETNIKIPGNIAMSEQSEGFDVEDAYKDLEISAVDDADVEQKIHPADKSGKKNSDVSKESLEDDAKISDDPLEQPFAIVEEMSMESATKINKSIVPGPLPTVKEPEDDEPRSDSDQKQIIVDVTNVEESECLDAEEKRGLIETVQAEDVLQLDPEPIDSESNEPVSIDQFQPSSVAGTVPFKNITPAESMEVEVSEESQVFQQDEPMEEEASDLDKS